MKLCGIDLNGMHDRAARSWFAGEETAREIGENKGDSDCFIVDGGSAGVAVEVGENTSDRRVVAGPQALFAPHGQGEGWGRIGEVGRRCRMVDALKEAENEHGLDKGIGRRSIVAAVDLFAQDADIAVFAIPDSGRLLERQQSTLLSALQETRARRIELVWRPVVLCLGLLNRLEPVLKTKRGKITIAILSDMWDSLQVTELELMARTWRGQEIIAPRRRQKGDKVPWEGCWEARVREALNAVRATNPDVGLATIERQSRIPFDIAAGREPTEEIVRDESGRWIEIKVPAQPKHHVYALPAPAVTRTKAADVIILDTPGDVQTAGFLKQAARRFGSNDRELIAPAPDTVARGALEAARRLARHEPPWFDFLPGIEVTVLRKGGRAEFQALIPAGEGDVPAGEPYRCRQPPSYIIRRGLEELEIYLEKEDEPQLRKWSAPFVPPPEREAVVTLRLEQRPTQGWARVEMTSDRWSQLRHRPIRLDWSTLEIEARSRKELLDDLNQSPGYPDRIVYQAHASHWDAGLDWRPSIEMYLRHPGGFDKNHGQLLNKLYNFFRSSSPPDGSGGKRFPLDTDGNLPDGLTEARRKEIEVLVGGMLTSLATNLDQCVRSGRMPSRMPYPTSRLFLPATWCFLRCPDPIRKTLVDTVVNDPAFGGGSATKPLLLRNTGGSTAVYHSLARCLKHPSEIAAVLDKVFQIPVRKFNQNHLACVSGLVSRRDTTIELLVQNEIWTRKAVEWACEGVGRFVQGKNRDGFYTYALLLCGGLLRVRRIRPNFLVLEEDESAVRVKRLLERSKTHITRIQVEQRRKQTLKKQTQETIEFLEGRGTNRNLLMEIDSSAPA